MAGDRAFALKDGVDGFVDAAVAVPPDSTPLSVGERLKEGKGVIVAQDEHEAEALATVDVLKQVSKGEASDIRKAASKSGGKDS